MEDSMISITKSLTDTDVARVPASGYRMLLMCETVKHKSDGWQISTPAQDVLFTVCPGSTWNTAHLRFELVCVSPTMAAWCLLVCFHFSEEWDICNFSTNTWL